MSDEKYLLDMEEYFALPGKSIFSKGGDLELLPGPITEKNFKKYTFTPSSHVFGSSYIYDENFYDEEDYGRGSIKYLIPALGSFWTKIQLYNYFLGLAKENNISKFSQINATQYYPLFVPEKIIEVDKIRLGKYVTRSTKDHSSRTLNRFEIVQRMSYATILGLIKKIKAVSMIKDQIWNFTTRPGSRIASDISDRLNQSSENKSIKHLLHCKNITYKDLVNITNLIVSLISEDKQSELMVHMISEYGKKYHVSQKEEYTFDELKNATKMIMLRISKYDLCQILDDMEYSDIIIPMIKLKN